jgi:predicted lipoprotein with Yx(FWY)xxD motif
MDVVSDVHGQQLSYNGHPLYRYAQDTAPGQTNGEGVGGKWFVATPGLSWQQ